MDLQNIAIESRIYFDKSFIFLRGKKNRLFKIYLQSIRCLKWIDGNRIRLVTVKLINCLINYTQTWYNFSSNLCTARKIIYPLLIFFFSRKEFPRIEWYKWKIYFIYSWFESCHESKSKLWNICNWILSKSLPMLLR